MAVAAAATLAAVPATPADGAVWLSKVQARRVAVTVTAQTCRVVDWCEGYEVVPARRCRRHQARTVHCSIAFLTAERRRCRGVVVVSKRRNGRIDRGMAVPMNCGAAGSGVITSGGR